MSILVINAGSTSLKFGLFDPGAATSLAAGTRQDLMIAREVRRMAGRAPRAAKAKGRPPRR